MTHTSTVKITKRMFNTINRLLLIEFDYDSSISQEQYEDDMEFVVRVGGKKDDDDFYTADFGFDNGAVYRLRIRSDYSSYWDDWCFFDGDDDNLSILEDCNHCIENVNTFIIHNSETNQDDEYRCVFEIVDGRSELHGEDNRVTERVTNRFDKNNIYDAACIACGNYEALRNGDEEFIEEYSGCETTEAIAQELYEKLCVIVDNWEELMNA